MAQPRKVLVTEAGTVSIPTTCYLVSGENQLSPLFSALHTGAHTTEECNPKSKVNKQMNKHEKMYSEPPQLKSARDPR